MLIGWAAVTGSLAAPAWALFAVVFFWQMPHFYALAINYRDDYARAGIPMLPVVASAAPGQRGDRAVRLADRAGVAGGAGRSASGRSTA